VHDFRGVETGQATLAVSVSDKDIPLGSSSVDDLAPLVKFDVMNPEQREVEMELAVEILPPGCDDAVGNPEPVCAVTLRFTFEPSNKDRREELYEVLNKCTQRKASVVEKLRNAAVAASRAQMVPSSTRSAAMTPHSSSKAVKAGFLNKQQPKKESKVMLLYNKYFGPHSFLRMYFPVARNYVAFVGLVAAMHFKGQLLALPPPV